MPAAFVREALQTNNEPAATLYQRNEPTARSKAIRAARLIADAN